MAPRATGPAGLIGARGVITPAGRVGGGGGGGVWDATPWSFSFMC